MIIRPVLPQEQSQFDSLVTHPIQSWAWGEFREQTKVKVIRLGQFNGPQMVAALTMTIHVLPSMLPFLGNKTISNCSRSTRLNSDFISAIYKTAEENRSIYVKLEPDISLSVGEDSWAEKMDLAYPQSSNLKLSEPWFAPYSASIDLTKSEDDLLASMKPKTRYNIGLARRHGVAVEIDNSEQAVSRYLDLMTETTKRQGFYAHTRDYHQKMWQTMHKNKIANLLVAKYNNQIITTWILFNWHDKLYYPYGASTRDHQQKMANYLVLWEAIQFGKRSNLKTFDLWGVLGPETEIDNPWYGFHRFKMSFSPLHIHYAPTQDLIVDSNVYWLFNKSNHLRKQSLKFFAKTKRQLMNYSKILMPSPIS